MCSGVGTSAIAATRLASARRGVGEYPDFCNKSGEDLGFCCESHQGSPSTTFAALSFRVVSQGQVCAESVDLQLLLGLLDLLKAPSSSSWRLSSSWRRLPKGSMPIARRSASVRLCSTAPLISCLRNQEATSSAMVVDDAQLTTSSTAQSRTLLGRALSLGI